MERIVTMDKKEFKMKNKAKNIAMIIAGGVGARMQSSVPKQFHIVKNKPIIVYTIEVFQKSVLIDEIIVVILKDYEDLLQKYIEEFKLTKVSKIVYGGDTGFKSIGNGVEYLASIFDDEDIILIHDAVRPLISEDIINANIVGVNKNGNAITVVPATEVLLYSEDGEISEKIVDRDKILRTQTPQSLKLKELKQIHIKAKEKGIIDSVATCTLLIETGNKVYTVLGENSNFKLTMTEDVSLFEAYLDSLDDK